MRGYSETSYSRMLLLDGLLLITTKNTYTLGDKLIKIFFLARNLKGILNPPAISDLYQKN